MVFRDQYRAICGFDGNLNQNDFAVIGYFFKAHSFTRNIFIGIKNDSTTMFISVPAIQLLSMDLKLLIRKCFTYFFFHKKDIYLPLFRISYIYHVSHQFFYIWYNNKFHLINHRIFNMRSLFTYIRNKEEVFTPHLSLKWHKPKILSTNFWWVIKVDKV